MKILHISDTHNKHHEISTMPEADVLVHTGDLSEYGTEEEVLSALEWLISLPYRHKVIVAGNHDLCLYDAENIEGLPYNVHFLHNGGVVINDVFFYGVTFTNPYVECERPIDVLLSHEPPLGILDYEDGRHWGTSQTLSIVNATHPKLHLFGHVHDSYGSMQWRTTTFSNASLMNHNNLLQNSPRLMVLNIEAS